jgi:hypothetical protein
MGPHDEDGGTLTIRYRPAATWPGSPISRPIRWSGTTIWSAAMALADGVTHRVLGYSLEGQPIDCLEWARARIRSGSMPASIPANRWPNGGWKARSIA